MGEPWKLFLDGVARRIAPLPLTHPHGRSARMKAVTSAAEELIDVLTREHAWPWAAARILAAKLADRAAVWVLLEDSLMGLRRELQLLWDEEREADPSREVWSRLVAPLLGGSGPGGAEQGRRPDPIPT